MPTIVCLALPQRVEDQGEVRVVQVLHFTNLFGLKGR